MTCGAQFNFAVPVHLTGLLVDLELRRGTNAEEPVTIERDEFRDWKCAKQ